MTYMVVSLAMFLANLVELGVTVKDARHDYKLLSGDENKNKT